MGICPNCFSSNTYENGRCRKCGFQNTVRRDSRALPARKLLYQRYIIGRVLGIGGFGITYVAYDVISKERVAIKEYYPVEWATRSLQDKKIVPNSMAREKLYMHGQEVFVNEAKILQGLKEIPTVVDVKGFFRENDTAYMVMELLEGMTLSKYMKNNGMSRMPYQTATQIIDKIGQALEYVHSYQLLHRDVGPDNIIITTAGEIKLIDFGATRIYGLNSPRGMSVLVKPGFAPIEQYSRTGNQGPWTDVYALASTYYYLLTGKKPPSATERISGSHVIPVASLVPGLPQSICMAIEHAMNENWQRRPRTMRRFLDEIHAGEKKEAVRTQSNMTTKAPDTVGRTRFQYEIETTKRPNRTPYIYMQVGRQRARYGFNSQNVLQIGRNPAANQVVINDRQISGIHCKVSFNPEKNCFLIENYSGNRTYTSRGTLLKNQSVYETKGQWLYIQTDRQRYIFYLEVV